MKTKEEIQNEIESLEDELQEKNEELAEELLSELDEPQKVVQVHTPVLPRAGQDYKRFSLEMTGFSKTEYDGDYSGGWYGTVHGTKENIFKFLTEECALDPDEAFDMVQRAK